MSVTVFFSLSFKNTYTDIHFGVRALGSAVPSKVTTFIY